MSGDTKWRSWGHGDGIPLKLRNDFHTEADGKRPEECETCLVFDECSHNVFKRGVAALCEDVEWGRDV